MPPITWPKQRSATSGDTPARDIRLRAVRRRSCRVHPLVPLALSSARFILLKPEIGRTPSALNTKVDEATGTSGRDIAASLSGLTKSTLALFLAAGSVQSLPSILVHGFLILLDRLDSVCGLTSA